MEVPIEHHIVPITEEDITTQEVDKIERFGDETERLYNRGKSMERLILRKCTGGFELSRLILRRYLNL